MKVIKTIATFLLAAGVVLLAILVLQNFGVLKTSIGSSGSAPKAQTAGGGGRMGGPGGGGPGGPGGPDGGGSFGGAAANAVYAVNTSPAVRGTILDYIKLNGDIIAKASVDVVSDKAGKLSRIAVSLGDRIAKDQIIAEVDPSTSGNQLAAVPIRSTISGIVTSVKGTVGQAVSSGSSIISVSGSDGIEAKALVPERYVGLVKQGSEADLSFDAYPGSVFKFRVTSVSPVLDTTSRTMEIRLEPALPDNRIKAGMFAKITLVTEKKTGALKIYTSGIVNKSDGTYLYVVDGESVARLKPVTLGIKVDGVAEVVKGLSAGENVVVAGQTLISDGAKVNVLKQIDPPGNVGESALSVKTAKAVSGEMVSAIRTNGSVISKTAVSVYPDASGKLTKLTVKIGDRVQKDQVIGEVDASKPGLQYVPNKVQVPISGIITALPVQEGATVSTATSIATISKPEDFQIKAEIPERSLYKVKLGLPVLFMLDAYPGSVFSGSVAAISPQVNSTTQTVEIGVSIGSVDERIKAGMFAQLELITDRSSNTVIVPRQALMENSEGQYIYVVRKNSTAERRKVLTGIMSDEAAEIISGISSGEDVIVQGQGLVREGVYVKIVENISTAQSGNTQFQKMAMEAAR